MSETCWRPTSGSCGGHGCIWGLLEAVADVWRLLEAEGDLLKNPRGGLTFRASNFIVEATFAKRLSL